MVLLIRRSAVVFCTIWMFYGAHFVAAVKPWKCLDTPEVIPKKYTHYMGHPTDIIIQTSDRPLHRLSTEIFKTFLEEIVGFAKVRIVHTTANFRSEEVVEKLSNDLSETEVFPYAMIDLEVWVPTGHDLVDWEDTQLVKEFGILAPPGRMGWFIPQELAGPVKHSYNKWDDHIREIHWSFLQDKKKVELFAMDGEDMSMILRNARFNGSFECMGPLCENGMYVPPQCQRLKCAVLLSSSFNMTDFVVDHIKELKLLVKVVWLGENLKATVDALIRKHKYNSNKSLLILHYTPSSLILREKNVISVMFPQCEQLNSTNSLGCKYELNRIVKMTWNKIDRLGLQQYVRNFKFNEEDYDYLLTLYERAQDKNDFRQIGCQWLKDRNSTWEMWIIDRDKNKIYIGGIFPTTGSSYNGPGIVKGAQLATEIINKDPSILKNYELKLIVGNGMCRADSVMKIFIDYVADVYYDNLIGVLGPACSDTVEPLAGVSKHYHMMVISYSAEGASFADREKYPYFFRTIGENKHYLHVYLKLFQEFKWKRVAALTEDGQKYTEYISHMQEFLQEKDITFIANTKFPRDRDTSQMARYLEDLKRKMARIIILDVFDEIARTVMCEALRLQMTSAYGYVWFLPAWLNSTWYNTDYFNKHEHESVNCTTAEMIQAATGYFSMAHAFYASNDSVIQGNMTVAEWQTKYTGLKKAVPQSSNYAGYAYDAVWTYALALDKMVQDDPEAVSDLHSQNTTNKLLQLIKDTDFNGVSGHIKFRGGASRFSIINVMQWYENKSHIIANFTPTLSDNSPEVLGGDLKFNENSIRWFTPDRETPKDGTLAPTKCALESLAKSLNVSCDMAIVILNIILISLLFLAVFAVVFILKRRYDKRVRFTEKYLRTHLGIDLRLNQSQISDLDKWEISRDSIVINRKLGEGAFGMVYGGEATLPHKGWVAVAVKTLKVGSSTDEKLDFLSEAEVMKRFDHKNVVKLLAVCTKEEPIYTIMEFMLYGDLKTFLLARRHLVSDKSTEESEEISCRKLTNMALDIARGLSYLAQIKYVHRDIASRNCLINAQRVVKLGDFGMTRPMFENDYYKFTRKGMLPVRWMSPESLALGVFTPYSDVWSFGVLLYEIITFGSFPYQGMTNTQVLEYVKQGNTVTIPPGVKTQLRGLLKSCWQQDPKMRTRASEIVEFLANNPRLISPCLEVPLASVQLEDTNQLEFNLPDQFRKCSTTSITAAPNSLIPNGTISATSPPFQHETPSDSGISIPLESYCPREPLLGGTKSTSSLISLGKYVSMQHHAKSKTDHDDDNDEEEDEEDDNGYLAHKPAPTGNGHIISKV